MKIFRQKMVAIALLISCMGAVECAQVASPPPPPRMLTDQMKRDVEDLAQQAIDICFDYLLKDNNITNQVWALLLVVGLGNGKDWVSGESREQFTRFVTDIVNNVCEQNFEPIRGRISWIGWYNNTWHGNEKHNQIQLHGFHLSQADKKINIPLQLERLTCTPAKIAASREAVAKMPTTKMPSKETTTTGEPEAADDINRRLYNAVHHGDVDTARQLLSQGANANYAPELQEGMNQSKYPMLIIAVSTTPAGKKLPMVQLLLANRADVNGETVAGEKNTATYVEGPRTALQWVVTLPENDESVQIVRTLMQHGAKVGVITRRGQRTPLEEAASKGRSSFVRELLESPDHNVDNVRQALRLASDGATSHALQRYLRAHLNPELVQAQTALQKLVQQFKGNLLANKEDYEGDSFNRVQQLLTQLENAARYSLTIDDFNKALAGVHAQTSTITFQPTWLGTAAQANWQEFLYAFGTLIGQTPVPAPPPVPSASTWTKEYDEFLEKRLAHKRFTRVIGSEFEEKFATERLNNLKQVIQQEGLDVSARNPQGLTLRDFVIRHIQTFPYAKQLFATQAWRELDDVLSGRAGWTPVHQKIINLIWPHFQRPGMPDPFENLETARKALQQAINLIQTSKIDVHVKKDIDEETLKERFDWATERSPIAEEIRALREWQDLNKLLSE